MNTERTAPLVIVSGLSGAGKTTALKALEDIGYEAVDNLPLTLLESVAASRGDERQALAVGIDIRTRDLDVNHFNAVFDAPAGQPELDLRVLYLDCDDEIIQRRFTETRRRHPLAADRPIIDGIRLEREALGWLRARADRVIDTSRLAIADLKRLLSSDYLLDSSTGLAIFVTSFAFPLGLPRDADLVFDVRFLANPHYDEALRPLNGLDPKVAHFIAADTAYQPFFDKLAGMLAELLPAYEREGKSYLTVALGCTGGRHRSVFAAERLAARLSDADWRVTIRHRDLESLATAPLQED